MSTDTELSEPLREHGYRPFDCALRGDWATNERYTVQIISKRGISRERSYIARVYDAPADAVELPHVGLVATASSGDHVEATRRAVENAASHNPA